MLQRLLADVQRLETILARGRSVNVNSRETRGVAIDLVNAYFRDVRPQLVVELRDERDLHALDEHFQHVVRLAQGLNARKSYRSRLRALRRSATELSVKLLTQPPGPADNAAPRSALEDLIVATLNKMLPSAGASYEQALLDLDPRVRRTSYRGSATELREAFREVLDHLAPDKEVAAEQGFRLEPNRTHPTMKQKVRYILRSRDRSKTQREATEKTADFIESLAGDVARAIYDRASLSTHAKATREEVLRLKRYVETVLLDLLELPDPSYAMPA